MTNNQLTENDLISRLLGRAKHLRDVGAIKSPELLEEAAAELQERRKADKPPVHPTVASEKLDDETLQELIEFRRTTLEYHSKEGNKVQTIIHGVTLSALRELQERRKADSVTAAGTDVLAERQRQITAEGWTPERDDRYKNTELAFAASCYAFHAAAASWDLEDDGIPYDSHPAPKQWPWDPAWWKPTDPRRDLVKAGALILAEIERIDRARSKSHE